MTIRKPALALCVTLGLGTLIATLAQCTEDRPAPTPAGKPVHHQDPATPTFAEVDGVRLLLSGSMLGRLEPCGCASGQLGGLPRRMQHIGEHRDYDILIEGGNLVAGDTELDLLKGFTALQVLYAMQRPYDVLGVGKNDLALPLDEWSAFLSMAPVVASDLVSTREDWPGVPFVEKAVREHTVRIASLSLTLPERPEGEELPFTVTPPVQAWQTAMAGADPATLRVLLFHGADIKAREIVPQLDPKPDMVACFDESYSEPGAFPEKIAGVPTVYPGIRGRVLLELSLLRSEDGPRLGFGHVPLPASKTAAGGGGDPDVRETLLQHRQDVAGSGLLQKLANQRPTKNGAKYIGSQACGACHQTAYESWKESPHAKAWQTLVDAEADPKRYGWPVTQYPDCVACHVVGYGEVSGFVDAKTTAQLKDVGCERCHGAGSEHQNNPAANKLGIIGGVQASVMCAQCHDFEQSPDFLYGDRWAKIVHGREDYMPKKRD